ncbi:type 1 fimbrial protein [Pseudomonas antarctica]|uniref:type 1 fimbrial protein n=1 Tax=Pseudomonas antarctica TaxID=219572 RepID=UPI003F75044F
MNVKGIGVFAGLFCLSVGTCAAAQTAGGGTLEFRGAIVEAGCATNARSGPVMELTECSSANRGGRIDVHSVASVASVDKAHVRLVADSGNGRYYDQRYLLVDNAGQPITSGNYVVTLTSP